jgi:MOSC domain-containing protein
MRTLETLEREFALIPPLARHRGEIVNITLRKGGGVHDSVAEAEISVEDGVIGDRWAASPRRHRHSQITMMNAIVGRLIANADRPGWESGDNFQVALDLSEENLPPGSRLRLGTALLEITSAPHTGCKKFSARFGTEVLRWVNLETNLPLRLRGVHCEVIEGGRARVGDAVVVISRSQR